MGEKRLNIVSNKELIFAVLLGAYATNFLNIGNIIPALFIPVVVIYIIKNEFTREFWLTFYVIVCFGFLYAYLLLTHSIGSTSANIGKAIFPACLFLLGHKLVMKDLNYKKTILFTITLIVSTTLFSFFSLVKTTYLYGDINSYILENGRYVVSIWGNTQYASTLINALLSFSLASIPLVFIKSVDKVKVKAMKFILLICFILSVYVSLTLLNRTSAMVVVVSTIFVYAFVFKFTIGKILMILGIWCSLVLAVFMSNIGINNITFGENNAFWQRMVSSQMSEDPRFLAWREALFGMFENPLGGKQTDMSLNFAHNLWLDVGYEGGVLPFILLLFLTTIAVISLYKFSTNNHPKIVRGLMISIFSAFFVCFVFEPILQGMTVYFTFFCFFVGIIQRLNYDKKSVSNRISYYGCTSF
ncbi:hypothetical protein CR205_16660 [Alteribacter lacisalsi]|uniref:O-antigen ligase family protein n=1 Tax=Alteribacter lacisalsi TaxID=2045244 RepID=A0A2W0H2I8_9BACI|nr:oligosaccharide repeat unit polymerase [Alteribacter lacisalsi]PYZ96003.1 hypothetical protein CR205_16660 [Alteribacter lacisalsi]